MSKVSKYLYALMLSGVLAVSHFVMVYPFTSQFAKKIDAQLALDLQEATEKEPIEGQDLARLFAVDFTAEADNTSQALLISDHNEGSSQSIFLDDVEVIIKAISIIGEQRIVHIAYKEQSAQQEIKVKLQQGDVVLGFTLEKSDQQQLLFRNGDKVALFKIFKSTN